MASGRSVDAPSLIAPALPITQLLRIVCRKSLDSPLGSCEGDMWETLGRLASTAFGSLGVIFHPYEQDAKFLENEKETPILPTLKSQGVIDVPFITPYKLPTNSHLGVTYYSNEVSYFPSSYLHPLNHKPFFIVKIRLVRNWKAKYLHSATISN